MPWADMQTDSVSLLSIQPGGSPETYSIKLASITDVLFVNDFAFIVVQIQIVRKFLPLFLYRPPL